MTFKWITIRKFSGESGYSEEAVRSKIKRGDWLEGCVWRKAPDGRVLINVRGYERWVSGDISASASIQATIRI